MLDRLLRLRDVMGIAGLSQRHNLPADSARRVSCGGESQHRRRPIEGERDPSLQQIEAARIKRGPARMSSQLRSRLLWWVLGYFEGRPWKTR